MNNKASADLRQWYNYLLSLQGPHVDAHYASQRRRHLLLRSTPEHNRAVIRRASEENLLEQLQGIVVRKPVQSAGPRLLASHGNGSPCCAGSPRLGS